MHRPWLTHYPTDMAHTVDARAYPSLAALVDDAFRTHADKPATVFMGAAATYGDIAAKAHAFAAFLQSLGLQKGERIALMMPNLPQYPIAVAAALKAGLVVVNTNPLYTPRELQHQLEDSGAKAIVILENMAATLAACDRPPNLRHVVVTRIADGLPKLKGLLVDLIVRRVKKLVPPYDLPRAIPWTTALKQGKAAAFNAPDIGPDDIAVLQYTGGTTGVSKGAMLLHRNVVANVLQSEAWHAPAMASIGPGVQPVTICALPIYHIFGFTVNMMLSMRTGGCSVLVPNPRDLPALIKALKHQPFHSLPAVNTLFAALARHPDANSIDWSSLKLAVGGGMAVQPATASAWLALTGTAICEGYGLSETSPSACCNPVTATAYSGTIGYPLPSTDMAILADDDTPAPPGTRGEVAIRGPQVMAGYWKRPEESARAMTADGFFRSGDIGIMDETGAFRIVDRKKDMINVSGFNVYPNEIEEVVTQMPGIAEAAAVGVPDEASGEAVKLFVVRADPAIDEAAVRAFCKETLTGYKRPKHIEFRDELPKTNVGKVLRRALRD